ncbi:hypothetical protein BDC45DRAFT_529861 [Circinella umbellata]|nr:hypothetical protein BDC45DRAFT_529861 [Circinella umbellata]
MNIRKEPLGTQQWRRFWSIPLNPIVQNFWFHILHQTVPNATTLHNTAANIPPSTSCLFCNSPDSLCHFLYSCPVKWAVWHTIWFDLLLYTLTINNVHHAIFSLRFPYNPSSLDTHTIVACIMHGIWSAHLNFYYHQVIFNHYSV